MWVWGQEGPNWGLCDGFGVRKAQIGVSDGFGVRKAQIELFLVSFGSKASRFGSVLLPLLQRCSAAPKRPPKAPKRPRAAPPHPKPRCGAAPPLPPSSPFILGWFPPFSLLYFFFLTWFLPVQLQIEDLTRKLRTGDLGIPPNPEDRSGTEPNPFLGSKVTILVNAGGPRPPPPPPTPPPAHLH